MKKNEVKNENQMAVEHNGKTVVSEKTQTVNVVHELDLHEMSLEEKALVGHLLLEGKPLPHPLTHEALSALMTANNTHADDEKMPAPTELSEAVKKLDQEFLQEMRSAADNKAGRIAAMIKRVTAVADELLGAARALFEKHKANRAAGSVHRDWVAKGLLDIFTQAAAADAYCVTPAHREAMKIVTGSPLQLFFDGQYADDLAAALMARTLWYSNPTKANWTAFRDAMRPKVVKNLRDLRRMLLEDSYVTNSMFEEMGQPDRPSGQRHPIPPPDYTPRVVINPVPDVPSKLAIELLTPTDKAVIGPNGLVGEVKIAIKPADVSPENIDPDDDSLNWHSIITTTAKFKPTVPAQMRNKMLILVARIVNKRKQEGEWGIVHTVQAT